MKNKKIFYGFIFLFFIIILTLSPISGDDWGNYLVGKDGLYHAIGNAVGMYFDWEGRFISRVFINILTYNKWLFNIVNSLLIVTLCILTNKLIKPKNKKTTLLFSLLIIIFMNLYTFSQTITWLAGTITYFFPAVIFILYFYLMLNNDKKKWYTYLFIIINITLPMFVEHMALVLIAFNIILLIKNYIKTKKVDKEILLYLIIAIITTITMLLSPGTKLRALNENQTFNKLNIIEKVIYNIPNFVYYTFIVNYFLLFIMSISNYFLIKNNIKNKYLKYVLIVFNFILCFGTAIYYLLSAFTNKVQLNPNNIFIIIAVISYLLMSFILIILYKRKETTILLFLLGIFANAVMLVSPTWGFRTSLFTYLTLAISSLTVIDDYLKDNKIGNLFLTGITSIGLLFYLILYINVFKCQNNLAASIKKQLKENKEVIEIESFPEFVNCNINPSNDYHLKKFKEYYKIPEDKQVIINQNRWNFILYK